MGLSRRMGHGPGEKTLHFATDPNKRTGPGIFTIGEKHQVKNVLCYYEKCKKNVLVHYETVAGQIRTWWATTF